MDKNVTTPRHSDMMIKVCGNRYPDNIHDVAALTPMLMGFIFHDGSPRNADDIDPKEIAELPPFVRPVCVTVNATEERLCELEQRYGFRILQLHGQESPEMCARLRSQGFVVIKAIGMSHDADWTTVAPYEGKVDMLLFDTACKSHGGSGRQFDWSLLASYPLSTPYMLSGGVGPEDVDRIIAAMRPRMAGVDINSRFENAPGRKDIGLLTRFIYELRKYNEDESPRQPFWEKA